MCGAEPVWASEIEKFPIKVTEHRFPNMKHYGDITKIKGDAVEPVHIIVGGSPCQDLSVAGLRKGMKHADFGDETTTRSGLFMEQIRIIKEMRDATRRTSTGPLPRYNIWENVPGAFSSNGGEDFRAVLEETARVADPSVSIPRSVAGWATSGSILGIGWSLSWRTLDSQYWGVPQRRRRIFLVADFNGHTAPEILFERDIGTASSEEVLPLHEGLRRHPSQSGASGQGASAEAEGCADSADGHRAYRGNGCGYIGPHEAFRKDMLIGFVAARREAEVYCLQGNGIDRSDTAGCNGAGWTKDVSYTLNTVDRPAIAEPVVRSDGIVCPTLTAYNLDSRSPQSEEQQHIIGAILKASEPRSVGVDCYNGAINGDLAATLCANSGDVNSAGPRVMEPAVTMVIREGKPGAGKGPLCQTDKASTLMVGAQQTLFEPCAGFVSGASKDAGSIGYAEELSPTLRSEAGGNTVPAVFVKTKRPNFKEDDERWVEGGVSPTLNNFDQGDVRTNAAVVSYDIGEARLRNPSEYDNLAPTITSRAGTGGNNVPAVVDLPVLQMSQPSNEPTNDIAPTLISRMGTGGNQVPVFRDPNVEALTNRGDPMGDRTDTLRAQSHGALPMVMSGDGDDICGALMARDYKGVGRTDTISRIVTGTLDCAYADKLSLENQHIDAGAPNFVKTATTVRRLTPLECERLQGYPDGWTLIDGATDSNRYKALGNSFTTFVALYVISGCIEVLEEAK